MSITCRTSPVRKAPGEYETATVEVEIEDPRQDEIRGTRVASGLGQSDDHIAPGELPVARGYEDIHAGTDMRGVLIHA